MNEKNIQQPSQIHIALILLWISLGVGLLISLIDSNPALAGVSTAFIVTVAVAVLAVMAFFIFHIGRGRNWARITFLILFLLGTWPFMQELVGMFNRSLIACLLSVTQFVLQISAIYLIFTKPGNAWFRKPA